MSALKTTPEETAKFMVELSDWIARFIDAGAPPQQIAMTMAGGLILTAKGIPAPVAKQCAQSFEMAIDHGLATR